MGEYQILTQTKPNLTQRNRKTRHKVPMWIWQNTQLEGKKHILLRSHTCWKMFIWGLRCSSKPMIMACLFLCQCKDNITQPRRTYQPGWPHLRCWRCECSVSLWRSQQGPPPCKTHTHTHAHSEKLYRRHTQNVLSMVTRSCFSEGGKKGVVLIKAQPYMVLQKKKKSFNLWRSFRLLQSPSPLPDNLLNLNVMRPAAFKHAGKWREGGRVREDFGHQQEDALIRDSQMSQCISSSLAYDTFTFWFDVWWLQRILSW